jgi:hypothetical protein
VEYRVLTLAVSIPTIASIGAIRRDSKHTTHISSGVSNKPALASKRADSIAIGKLSNINVTRLVVEKVQPGAFFAYFLSRGKKVSARRIGE